MAKVYRNISPNGLLTTIYGVFEAQSLINTEKIPAKVLQSWVKARLIVEEDGDEGEDDDLETRLAIESVESDEDPSFEPTLDDSKPNPGNPPVTGFTKPAAAGKPANTSKKAGRR